MIINSDELREDLMATMIEEDFVNCQLNEGEDKTNSIEVEGLDQKFNFNLIRLESHREFIKKIIDEMPEEFLKEGESFLKLTVTSGGYQWTTNHKRCEQFVVMAIGLGLAEYVYPKETWIDFPGGLPIVKFKKE